jgi:hypothetical protein
MYLLIALVPLVLLVLLVLVIFPWTALALAPLVVAAVILGVGWAVYALIRGPRALPERREPSEADADRQQTPRPTA